MLMGMSLPTLLEPFSFEIGTMKRPQLMESLRNVGVQLNDSAIILLDNPTFDSPEPETVTVVEHSLIELGLEDGAVLSRIFQIAREGDLDLCPPSAAPYLRLALRNQGTAPDTVMSDGHTPSGSLTVASPPLQSEASFPKGFYLRVVDGQNWLRGYRCDDEYEWGPHDRFVFRADRSLTASISAPHSRHS